MEVVHPLPATIPLNHFLALPRPDHGQAVAGTPDTSTLAAHDFDVDTRTGFMPPRPLQPLPQEWEPWERTLGEARLTKLQLAEKPGLTLEEAALSEHWRSRVRELPILSITNLKQSEILLRRAHHVLSWIMHFYVHTLPLHIKEIHIPAPIALPLLQVSTQLQLPVVLTYSDDVVNNWDFITPPASALPPRPPALNNLRCLTLFTGTRDEEEFYLASARIEFRGVEALTLMRAVMDEAFLGDATALRRITSYLHTLAGVIGELTTILADVRKGCHPDVFYHQIRPWFRGADSDGTRKWVFDGLELDATLQEPTELSGPSAGQSSLVHALDIFLGVDQYSHANFPVGKTSPAVMERAQTAPVPATRPTATATFSSAPGSSSMSFLDRMQLYMPRHHRAFLRHLSANPRPIRTLVETTNDAGLLDAYNTAVSALKVFRDEHVKIVALYILVPSKKARDAAGKKQQGAEKGTGGTDAFQFVKGVRDQTIGALLKPRDH